MENNNLGFTGNTPENISIENNINKALSYQKNHDPISTLFWFYNHVRNNKDGHLSISESMDYKQIDSKYAEFGNYNFGAVGRALGYSDEFLKIMAGVAQIVSNGNWYMAFGAPVFENYGDNPGKGGQAPFPAPFPICSDYFIILQNAIFKKVI